MKTFKKLMITAMTFIAIQQSIIAYDKSADNAKPQHQGWGRLGTATGNILTLHPGNSVNALTTGDQSNTTFGWHKDEDDRVKANRARTEHNKNKKAMKKAEKQRRKEAKQKQKKNKKDAHHKKQQKNKKSNKSKSKKNNHKKQVA